MTPRFRVVAGPNGSGKTTLMRRLAKDYAVNFYDWINADDIFEEVSRTGAYAPKVQIDGDVLAEFAAASEYPDDVRRAFASGAVSVSGGIARFRPDAVNSYTVALFAAFLQSQFVLARHSFSQETVFSHASKIQALEAASRAGFRTYLYFVATDSPEVNAARVANREKLGGHSVPPEKIAARYARSIANARAALPFLSRAYFFDNSDISMRYLGEWTAGEGFAPEPSDAANPPPAWLSGIFGDGEARRGGRSAGNGLLASSAAEAGRQAAVAAAERGLPVTVARNGNVITIPPEEVVK